MLVFQSVVSKVGVGGRHTGTATARLSAKNLPLCADSTGREDEVSVSQNTPLMGGGAVNDILLPNGPTLVLRGPPDPVLGSPCPLPGKAVTPC